MGIRGALLPFGILLSAAALSGGRGPDRVGDAPFDIAGGGRAEAQAWGYLAARK